MMKWKNNLLLSFLSFFFFFLVYTQLGKKAWLYYKVESIIMPFFRTFRVALWQTFSCISGHLPSACQRLFFFLFTKIHFFILLTVFFPFLCNFFVLAIKRGNNQFFFYPKSLWHTQDIFPFRTVTLLISIPYYAYKQILFLMKMFTKNNNVLIDTPHAKWFHYFVN